VVAIVPAATTSLSHPQPVGCPVADSGKTLALDKSLRKARRDLVFELPIGTQPPQDSAQNVAGQMWHAHMGQNEKTAIVNYQAESLLALLSTPADEAITSFCFPGRSAKEHAGQVASITVPNQVTQVLARGTLEAQVMMLRQMTNKGVGLSRACFDSDDFQRLKSSKRSLDHPPAAPPREKSSGSESARRI